MAENFVLVHGAWHGGFCWAAVINELGKHGDHTWAVDLPGNNANPFERAKVTAVSGTVVTVAAADGTTWTWHLVANSVIAEKGQQVAAGKLAKGEQVLVAGPVVNSANDARLVRIRPAR